MMGALEPPSSLIEAPCCQSGHGLSSSWRTRFVTAQARKPTRAVIHTVLAAFGNSDKENL